MALQLSEIGYCLILLRRPRIFFITIVMPRGVIMFNKILNGILDVVFMVMILLISILGMLIVGL
jgi:hypothetical protein